MIKILIVEDQTLLRDSLEVVINNQGDMKVVGTTGDALKVPQLCRELKPDLILMDIVTENKVNGITIAEKLLKEFVNIKIVIMTAYSDITFIDAARKAKIQSYICKNVGNEQMVYVIRSTMNNLSIYIGPTDNSSFANKFTENELAVIRSVCEGKTRKDIKNDLGISETTFKPIITSILDKTGFDNIMEFAIYASMNGLITQTTDGRKN